MRKLSLISCSPIFVTTGRVPKSAMSSRPAGGRNTGAGTGQRAYLPDSVQESADEGGCPGHEQQDQENGDDSQSDAPEDDPGDRERDDQDPEGRKE